MNELTNHHLIPKSKNWSSNPENIIRLKDNVHSSFHLVFSNDTPNEQLIRLLTINSSVLRWEYRKEIMKIIEEWGNDSYNKKALKKSHL